MTPEGALQCSHKPTTQPSIKPDKSSPCPPYHFFKIHFSIIILHVHLSLQAVSLLHVTPPPAARTLYVFLFSPIHYTRPAHTILLQLITLIVSDAHKKWHSSLHSFVQPSVTSSLLGPNSFLTISLSNTSSLYILVLFPATAQSQFLCSYMFSLSSVHTQLHGICVTLNIPPAYVLPFLWQTSFMPN
jgi:hypothetical protein